HPDMERAERAFRKILLLDKTNPLACHYLGKLLYWQNKWAGSGALAETFTYQSPGQRFFHALPGFNGQVIAQNSLPGMHY
ncbi:MAG: hypothetical protein IPI66_08745, partial [Chitinophagaceae bacterium]|nr:hypothetical protein [Chitinophagaceae bacterium]